MRFDEHFSLFKVKIHFWFLHFGPILVMVPKLILHLDQFLKLEVDFILVPAVNPVTENAYVANGVHFWHVIC